MTREKKHYLIFILAYVFFISQIGLIFASEPDFLIGGTAYDWLVMRHLGGYWQDTDPLAILKTHGIEYNRIGVCIKHREAGHPDSWCSIEYAEEVIRSTIENQMGVDLFFYLSDTAAHAGQQPCPESWTSYSIEEKAEALRNHTYEVSKYYHDRGFVIDLIEIGNEIDFGILDERPPLGVDWFDPHWMRENIWEKEAIMLTGAIEGVKRVYPDAQIVLHIGNTARPEFVHAFFNSMLAFNVPYDIAGLSFYPSYTGNERPSMESLEECIEKINALDKKVLISEYGYPSSPSIQDPILDGSVEGYPLTPEGQASFVEDFLGWCYGQPGIIGAFYFYPDNFLSETEPDIHGAPHTSLFYNDSTIKPALESISDLSGELASRVRETPEPEPEPEPEPQPQQEPEPELKGIPGFPYLAITLGLGLAALFRERFRS